MNVRTRPTMAARPFHVSASGPNPTLPIIVSFPGNPSQSTALGSQSYCRPAFARGSRRYLAMPSPSNGVSFGSAMTHGASVPATTNPMMVKLTP